MSVATIEQISDRPPDRPPRMSLSQCPVCHEEVAVPDSLPTILRHHTDSEMRCPWCGEQSPLRQLRITPMIEIVDRDGQSLPVQAFSAAGDETGGSIAEAEFQSPDVDGFDGPTFAIDTGNADPGGRPSSVTGESVSTGSFDESEFRLSDPTPSSAMSNVGTGSLRTSPAPRTKSSPMGTLLGFLVGPPIALVLGYFILSAFGRVPDLGFWPFTGSDKSGRSSRVAAAPVQPSVDRPRPKPMQEPVPMTMPEPVGEEPVGEELVGEEPVGEEPVGEEPVGEEPVVAPESESSTVEPADVLTNDQTEVRTPAFDESVDVAEGADLAVKMLKKLPDVPNENLRPAIIQTYRQLAEVGSGGPNRVEAAALLQAVIESPHQEVLRRLGPKMLAQLARDGRGLFLIGERVGDRMVGDGDLSMRLMIDDDAAAGDGPVMVFGVVNEDSSAIRASIVEAL